MAGIYRKACARLNLEPILSLPLFVPTGYCLDGGTLYQVLRLSQSRTNTLPLMDGTGESECIGDGCCWGGGEKGHRTSIN